MASIPPRGRAFLGRIPLISAVVVLVLAVTASALVSTIDSPATASRRAVRVAVPSTTVVVAPPAAGGFPTRATAGVPAGWQPTQTRNGNVTISTAGAVVEDMRINGSLIINAPNVTVRRVEVIGGVINNYAGPTCKSGLVIERTTITRGAGQTTSGHEPAVLAGGYTARWVKIDGLPEGFRVGGKSDDCGPVLIENSYVSVVAPDNCNDWHGDGLQGYYGAHLTIRNTYIEMNERNGCWGTAPFFYPANQGNTSVDIDGLIVKGGGNPFRLGMPGTVRNLGIVNNSWGYNPIDVKCSAITSWDARIVNLDANGQPVTVRTQPCNTNGGV